MLPFVSGNLLRGTKSVAKLGIDGITEGAEAAARYGDDVVEGAGKA